MRLASVLSGAPFRTALLALAVFVPVLALVGTTLQRSLGRAMLAELDAQVVAELVLLHEIFDRGGEPALLEAVRRMQRPYSIEPRLAALFDGGGRRLAGELDVTPDYIGWGTLEGVGRAGARGDVAPRYRSRTERWRGTTIVVGRSLRIVERTLAAQRRHLLLAGLAVIVLCLAIGYAASRRTHDKLARVAATLDRVARGENAARLPIGRSNDQIDRVSRQINEHLERLAALMGGMRNTIGAIAHDLRTPLGRASLHLQEALAEERLDACVAARLEAAAGELDALGGIIDTTLRIGRIAATDDTREFRRLALAPLVEELADVFRPVAEEAGQTLEIDPSPPPPEPPPFGPPPFGSPSPGSPSPGSPLPGSPSPGSPSPGTPSLMLEVFGDERMLRQMLANLVENAIGHCPAGTRIRLGVAGEPRGGASLTVEDDGPGIPDEARERVLEPFFRLDASRSTPGSGLGLALVEAVVRRHGARLALADNTPGLRVVVAFPPPPPPAPPAAPRR